MSVTVAKGLGEGVRKWGFLPPADSINVADHIAAFPDSSDTRACHWERTFIRLRIGLPSLIGEPPAVPGQKFSTWVLF